MTDDPLTCLSVGEDNGEHVSFPSSQPTDMSVAHVIGQIAHLEQVCHPLVYQVDNRKRFL